MKARRCDGPNFLIRMIRPFSLTILSKTVQEFPQLLMHDSSNRRMTPRQFGPIRCRANRLVITKYQPDSCRARQGDRGIPMSSNCPRGVRSLPASFSSCYEKNREEPLSSVWELSDAELLEAMLQFYPTIKPEPILYATYNAA